MIRWWVFPMVLMSSAAYAECTVDDKVLAANYQIESGDGRVMHQQTMTLWRNHNQVAHEYSDSHITELWERLSNGMLRLERHFDEYQRGIEYHPLEINAGKGAYDWDVKSQLISDQLLAHMTKGTESGKGCDYVEVYSLQNADKTVMLEWMPHQRLIKSYREESDHRVIQWRLSSTEYDEKKVSQAFIERAHYSTTDYADIGDNESDPFLLKMINLGHVEHGASGFYDASGHPLQGHDSHTH